MQDLSSQALSERVSRMAVSATLAMAQKAREMASQGIEVIKLSLGEPDFGTPQHIKDAAKQAIDEGYTFYPPVAGYPELKEAIAQKLKRDNGLEWGPQNIVVSTGAKQSLANIMMALINPGDQVLVFCPYWVTYSEQVKLVDGEPVYLRGNLENDFKINPQQLREALQANTRVKAILFSTPSNPTGSVYSHEELAGLVKVLEEYPEVMVITDEIYEYIVFEGAYHSIGSFPSIKDRVITVNGFSKGFAMTGWRVGYIAAPQWFAKACDKVQGQITSGTCSIAQRAALAAITSDLGPTYAMRDAYRRRRDLILDLVKDIPGIKPYTPNGAFYLFPDISYFFGKSDGEKTMHNADELTLYILEKCHIALVTGSAFGAPECIRISYAASDEQIIEAMGRIKDLFSKFH